MSLNIFIKNYPRVSIFVIIIICGLLGVIMAIISGFDLNSSILLGSGISMCFIFYFITHGPSKEIDQFVKNISSEILSTEKSVLGFRIKTKDFELIRINYLPPSNTQEVLKNTHYGQAKFFAGISQKLSESSYGTDVFIFFFEIPKKQTTIAIRSTREFEMFALFNRYEAWHEIKQFLGNDGALIKSGAITTDDNIIFIILVFDRAIVLKQSKQVYETLKAVKNKILSI